MFLQRKKSSILEKNTKKNIKAWTSRLFWEDENKHQTWDFENLVVWISNSFFFLMLFIIDFTVVQANDAHATFALNPVSVPRPTSTSRCCPCCPSASRCVPSPWWYECPPALCYTLQQWHQTKAPQAPRSNGDLSRMDVYIPPCSYFPWTQLRLRIYKKINWDHHYSVRFSGSNSVQIKESAVTQSLL